MQVLKNRSIHAYCELLKLPAGLRIPYFGGLLYRTLSRIENRYIHTVQIPDNPLNNTPREEKVIVSLTTFPARINQVEYAIKSLMLQTYRPDRIVLWLAAEQFPERIVPKGVQRLVEKGLEIRFCEDFKSFKKYFIALQEQKPDELVITFDDDIIYGPYSVERAVKKHREFPDCIVCNQCHEIRFDKTTERPLSYRSWKLQGRKASEPGYALMALTGSGCLYPYGALPAAAFDWDTILRTAPTADDLWIKAMSILNGTKVVRTDVGAKTFSTVSESQTVHLAQINCMQNGNDIIFNKLVEEFPAIKEKILSEQ